MAFKDHPWKQLLLVHVGFFILRALMLLLGEADLFIEEAQYWVWSKRPALSYYSKPPIVAYLNLLSTSLFGSTEFGVKINALTLGVIYSCLIYLFSFELFRDKRQAFLASVVVYALPFNHSIFSAHTTDAPLLVCWALTTIYFWRALQSDSLRHWVAVGVFAGLGFLSKYTMVFFAPIGLLYILWVQPTTLRSRGLYLSLVIAILFMLPVFIWNWQMDFISFKHVYSEGSKELTLSRRLVFASEYLAGQLGLLSPFLFFFLVVAVVRGMKSPDPRLRYLILAPVVAFAFFQLYALNKRVEVNWPVFAYFSVPILLAHYYEGFRRKRLLIAAFVASVTLVITFFYFSAYLQPVGLNKIVPPKKDPIRRVYGWDDLGRRVQQYIERYGQPGYFIFSDSYHVASEVAFYTEDQQIPYCVNLGRRYNQFDLWEGIEQFEGTDVVGIFVSKEPELSPAVIAGFSEVIAIDQMEIELGGEIVWRYHIGVFRGLTHIKEVVPESY